MTTIKDLLSLQWPVTYTTAYKNRITPAVKAIDPQLLFGVELEIENVPNWDDLIIHGMSSVADGSLRNNGREFLMLPCTYENAYATLSEFFRRANLNETNYSDRTSIHVHTNCQDLTVDQLQTVLFLYQAMETLVFKWVNPDRADNIFCVPWSQTNLSFQIFDGKRDLRKFQNWAKYTALNLLPLYSYGTIEWRHMNGHCDTEKLFKWLQIISCFFRYARENNIDSVKEMLLTLNTTSLYNRFIDSVFQEHVDFIYTQPDWQIQLEEGLLMLKYAVSMGGVKPAATKEILGVLDDLAEAPINAEPGENTVRGNAIVWNTPIADYHLDEALTAIRRAEQDQILRMNMARARNAAQAPQPRPIPPVARQRNNNGNR